MDKIWLSHYQMGVDSQINIEQYSSIVSLIDDSCAKYGNLIAYENMGSTLTYSRTQQLSQQFANYLHTLGLQPGSRVAIMMPNILQYPIAIFGILRAGYTVVNTNPLYTPDELVHQIRDSGTETIIVLEHFAHVVAAAVPRLPMLKNIIITQIADLFPAPKRFIINNVVKYIKKMIPDYNLPNTIFFNTALSIGEKAPHIKVNLTHNDLAFLQYTGGTTGVSKGAMLSHGNMIANILQASAWVKPVMLDHNDIIVTALPLYHIFSLTANCFLFFKLGAKNLLITNPRDLPGFIKSIKKSGFTALTGVNTLFNALLNNPKFHDVDFSKLKFVLSGGMSLQESVAHLWQEQTHTIILEAYGLTETSPAVSINPMNLKAYNGSIGLPLPSTEIAIRDENGIDLPIGEAGELCVKGPQVMSGYWNSPAETAKVFWQDGFLRTGDRVTIDKMGFLYLIDRLKDLIIVSGFNVYPNEIENVISQIPGVLEVGVVGVVTDGANEAVKACIVKRDPNLTAAEITTYARKHLTAYKVPKIIEFYKELPKTNVGKILRRALKDQKHIDNGVTM